MESVIDYLIIGAGAAGIHAAYQLKKQYPTSKVEIFESSHLIGGRAKTVIWNGIKINLGAEHIRKTDTNLLKLISEVDDGDLEFREEQLTIGSKRDIQWVADQIKVLNNSAKNRHEHTMEEWIKEKKLIPYEEFLVSYGYTDFTKSDIVDTMEHYGFDDFHGDNVFYKIDWFRLWTKLIKLQKLKVNLKSTVTDITEEKEFCRCVINDGHIVLARKVLYCGTVERAKILFRAHNQRKLALFDQIATYPFVKIFIKTNKSISDFSVTHFGCTVQRMFKYNDNTFCIYADSDRALELVKHIEEISWLEKALEQCTKLDDIRILDIYPVYWNQAVHYFKPLDRKYRDRIDFRTDVQLFSNKINILGEMVSQKQGWVEGAIESYWMLYSDRL